MNQRPPDRVPALPPRSVSLTVLVVLATLATILGLFARGDRHVWGDIRLLEAIQRIDIPGLDGLATVSNMVFGTAGALILAMLVIGIALLLHRPTFVLMMVIVITLRLAGQVLKPIFQSPRPGIEYQPDPSLVSSTFGYPSGHAYTATIVTSMIVILMHSLDLPRWARIATVAAAVLVTLAALFSRVKVGAHWPSDTIGGVMYGIATVALMQLVVGFIRTRRRPHETVTDR